MARRQPSGPSGPLDAEDGGGEEEGAVASGSGRAGRAGRETPSQRYVYGGSLPSSEKLQQVGLACIIPEGSALVRVDELIWPTPHILVICHGWPSDSAFC